MLLSMGTALQLITLDKIKHIVQPIPLMDNTSLASVLIPLIPRGNDWELLFVHRSNNTPTHKGQVAFPGGRVSPKDHNYVETVLRETREETSIPSSAIEILGAMPPRYTYQAKFNVLPIVGVITRDVSPQPDSYEISDIFTERVTNLLQNFVTRELLLPDGSSRLLYYYRSKYLIWGFTARVLHDFFSSLGLQKQDTVPQF